MTETRMTERGWGALPLIVGLGMALATCLAAMIIYWLDGVESFPEILYACSRTGLKIQACSDLAYKAGFISLVIRGGSFLVLLAGALWLLRKAPPQVYQISREAKLWLIVAVLLVLLVHIVCTVFLLPVSSRIEDIRRFSLFISAENVVWPLLLQLYVHEKEKVDRFILLSVLISVVLVTPYRAVGVAIAIFGFILPVLTGFWSLMVNRTWRQEVRPWLTNVILALVMTLSIGAQGLLDTANRTTPVLLMRDLPKERAKEIKEEGKLDNRRDKLKEKGIALEDPAKNSFDEDMISESTEPRFHQRLLYPIVQAGMIEHLAKTENLPGPLTELKRKFRLTEETNLNEYVYKRIYGGKGVGETTSLVYGEATAYFGDFALGWMIFVPFSLAALWYTLRRKRIDISTIAGIALWRSSFSGLITVLPGIVLQVGGALGLAGAFRMFQRFPQLRAALKNWSLNIISVLFVLLGLAQISLLLGFMLSSGSVEAMVTVGRGGCVFERQRLDTVLQEQLDTKFRYDVTYITPNLLSFVVPAGVGADERISDVRAAMDKGLTCPLTVDPEVDTTTRLVKTTNIDSQINIMNILALAAIILTLALMHKNVADKRPWLLSLRRKHAG